MCGRRGASQKARITYTDEGSDAVREELEIVRRARRFVREPALGPTAVVASEVDAWRGLRLRGDAVQRDLEDAVPVRAEAELQLAICDDKVRVDWKTVECVRRKTGAKKLQLRRNLGRAG